MLPSLRGGSLQCPASLSRHINWHRQHNKPSVTSHQLISDSCIDTQTPTLLTPPLNSHHLSQLTPPQPNLSLLLCCCHRSLRDFGLGKSSIAEGGLGLFTLVGGLAAVALLVWVKGTALRKGRPYQATLEFPLACGITVGTPVSCDSVVCRV